MPVVTLDILAGATREQKRALVREFTDTLVRVLGKRPEHTHVIIRETDEADWGFAGELTDEWHAAQGDA